MAKRRTDRIARVSILFGQVPHLFPRAEFATLVKKHDAEYRTKGFTCWSHFVSMMFRHLAGAESLREIAGGLKCCMGKLRRLGVFRAPNMSTLSCAHQKPLGRLIRGPVLRARHFLAKGGVKIHVLLDHDHYMPAFVRITPAREI